MRLIPLQTCANRIALGSIRRYSKSPLSEAFKSGDDEEESQVRYRSQKTPVIPSVQALDKRWNQLDAGQQDDIISYLEDKMRSDWNEMTHDEKRAAWYVWFGKWGPRSGKAGDLANLYLYLAGAISISGIGLGLYKWSVWDASEEIKGINYDN